MDILKIDWEPTHGKGRLQGPSLRTGERLMLGVGITRLLGSGQHGRTSTMSGSISVTTTSHATQINMRMSMYFAGRKSL